MGPQIDSISRTSYGLAACPASHAEAEERSIINIASVFGIKMFAPGGRSTAHQGGCRALTEGLRMELHSQNIRCTMISPGAIATELSESSSDERQKEFARVHENGHPPARSPERSLNQLSAGQVEVDEMSSAQRYRDF